MKSIIRIFVAIIFVAVAFPFVAPAQAAGTPCTTYWQTGHVSAPVSYHLIVPAGQEAAVDSLHIEGEIVLSSGNKPFEITPHTDAALLGLFGPGEYNLDILVGSVCIGLSDPTLATHPVLDYRKTTTGIPSWVDISEFWLFPQGIGPNDVFYAHSGYFAEMSISNFDVAASDFAVVDSVSIVTIDRGVGNHWEASMSGGKAPITQLAALDDYIVTFDVGAIAVARASDNLAERNDCDNDNDGAAACAPGYYNPGFAYR